VEVAHKGGERNVENGVVDPDDGDAQAERQEREPPPLIRSGLDRHLRCRLNFGTAA
jgi:hypothetical protein